MNDVHLQSHASILYDYNLNQSLGITMNETNSQ